ncbi:MAG: pyridoxal phosphate-dependent decarboxylase family protein [Paracoccaceae bacterium]|nr:aspartate aminotransferase family protein [Paracoccaceae bacterium]
MEIIDYKKWSNKATEWGSNYLLDLQNKPVRPNIEPGSVASLLPDAPPEEAEDPEVIFSDFEKIVPNAMTHWQHPRFFAYFPSNASVASIVAEQLVNTIAAQCMLWQTSPAATEIEEVMVQWLRSALGLPKHFSGTIHDAATTATLSAVLTMRELALDHKGLEKGLFEQKPLRIYSSAQTHSSIDKAVRLSGIGQNNLVKIKTDNTFAMRSDLLEKAILDDIANDLKPAGIIICIGGTSIGAFDDVKSIIKIAKKYKLYTHVDAAWAGSAMICPEYRLLWEGVEEADSIVFNPHKWLGAQADCSVQFLSNPTAQINTLGLRPDYLQTLEQDEVTNFNEWTIPLGRRFRALKLWFLLRAYGLKGLREIIRNHIRWVEELEEKLNSDSKFKVITNSRLALFTFQYVPVGEDANQATEELLKRINNDGTIYLTQTTHEGKFVIRMTAGQFYCTREDILTVYDVLKKLT